MEKRLKRTGPQAGEAVSQVQMGKVRTILNGQGLRDAKRLEPVWIGQHRVHRTGTYGWEYSRDSRVACERGDGDGVCGSHRSCSASQERGSLRREENEADGVTNTLCGRTRTGECLLWGVGGPAREGAGEVREEEREGGSFNDAPAT